MSRFYRSLIITGCILVFAASALAEQIVITRTELPANVFETFRKAYPTADLDKMTIYTYSEDTLKYYRIVTVNPKDEVEVVYMPTGKMVQAREVIVMEKLPEPVRVKVVETYPSANINLIEQLLPSDGKTFYKLYLVSDDRQDTLLVSPEGTIIQVTR